MTTEGVPGADSQIGVDFHGQVSDSEAAGDEARQVEHHCQICPNCGEKLTGHRCKLVCDGCGYYMSCADYY